MWRKKLITHSKSTFSILHVGLLTNQFTGTPKIILSHGYYKITATVLFLAKVHKWFWVIQVPNKLNCEKFPVTIWIGKPREYFPGLTIIKKISAERNKNLTH